MSRLVTGTLAMSFLAIFGGVASAADGPKDILIKAIKAHGGEEVLTKYLASQSKNKGKLTLDGIGEVEFTQETAVMMPDKFKETLEVTVMGQKVNVVTLVSGDKISIERNGMDVPISDQVKAAMKEAQHRIKVARMVAPVKEKGYELSAAGEIKVEDKLAVGVRVSAKGYKDVTLYFDKTTGLLAKFEGQTVDASTGNDIMEERFVLEYQKNNLGIPSPKKILVKRDGKTFMEAEITEPKMLEKLEDSVFSK